MEMIDEIDWSDSTLVDFDNIEYTIRDNNRIEIDTCDIDAGAYRREIEDGIDTLFNDLWAEHEMRVEIVNENN